MTKHKPAPNFEIVNQAGKIVGTVRTDSAERALSVHCAMLGVSSKGLTARPSKEFI